jgi:hypothetical protein
VKTLGVALSAVLMVVGASSPALGKSAPDPRKPGGATTPAAAHSDGKPVGQVHGGGKGHGGGKDDSGYGRPTTGGSGTPSEPSAARAATEYIDFSVPPVVWTGADGLPATVERGATATATIRVLVTGDVTDPRVDVHGEGANVDCTLPSLTIGVVATVRCTVVVQARNAFTIRATVHGRGAPYETTWTHAVS